MTNNIEKKEIEATKFQPEEHTYNPNHLIDSLIQYLNLKNDAALARVLGIAPPVISKIRHNRLPVGASLLVRMHEASELSIKELRRLMGDHRDKFHFSKHHSELQNGA